MGSHRLRKQFTAATLARGVRARESPIPHKRRLAANRLVQYQRTTTVDHRRRRYRRAPQNLLVRLRSLRRDTMAAITESVLRT